MTKAIHCKPIDFQQAHERRFYFLHIAPPGVTLAMVMEPEYWSAVGGDISRTRFPMIEVIAEDGTWDALLRVTASDKDYAKTRIIWKWEETAANVTEALPRATRVEYVERNGWRALGPDNVVIAEKLATRAEAATAARNYVAARKATA